MATQEPSSFLPPLFSTLRGDCVKTVVKGNPFNRAFRRKVQALHRRERRRQVRDAYRLLRLLRIEDGQAPWRITEPHE